MKYIVKKIVSGSVFCLILFLFVFNTISGNVMSSENIEEDANTVLSSDNIVTGEMSDYSKTTITVNGVSYNFCKNVKVFSTDDAEIPLTDIDAAEKVRLFENKMCVRKIKVLTFAQ